MTTTALKDPTTGRFIPRPPLPVCQGCGRVLFENLATELICVWPRCELVRQVVGHSGADAGVLGS
jgi:hypothetical protein